MVDFQIVLINNQFQLIVVFESKFDSNSDILNYLNRNSIQILSEVFESKTFEYQKLLIIAFAVCIVIFLLIRASNRDFLIKIKKGITS